MTEEERLAYNKEKQRQHNKARLEKLKATRAAEGKKDDQEFQDATPLPTPTPVRFSFGKGGNHVGDCCVTHDGKRVVSIVHGAEEKGHQNVFFAFLQNVFFRVFAGVDTGGDVDGEFRVGGYGDAVPIHLPIAHLSRLQ